MGIRENIAEHLKEYKTQRGLSLRALAETLQVGLGTVQNCLHGRGNPSLETLLFLAQQMGIPPEELFQSPDHRRSRQEAAEAYLQQLRRIAEGEE